MRPRTEEPRVGGRRAADPRVAALGLTPMHLDNLLGKRGRVLEVTEAFG